MYRKYAKGSHFMIFITMSKNRNEYGKLVVAKEQSWVDAENTICLKKLANKLRGSDMIKKFTKEVLF